MSRRKMQIGICRLCKKKTELSFEHIPPKSAFNKYTKFRTIPFIEYVENSHLKDYKPISKLQQGGTGHYCLCRKCNTFLGVNYVPHYFKMAQVGKGILQNPNFEKAIFRTVEISPLRLLKQVISMFVCINESTFTDNNPELLNFIRNPQENQLPEKFRVFMYLNQTGQLRNLAMMYLHPHGLINELAFPPLGFVMSIDSKFQFPLTEITHFKNIDAEYGGDIDFELLNLPTYSPFPLDYRTQEEIDEARRKSEEENEDINESPNC